MLEKIFKSRKQKVKLTKIFDFCFLKNKQKVLVVVKHSVDFSGNLRIAIEELRQNNSELRIFVYKDGIIEKNTKRYLLEQNIIVLEGFTFYTLFHIITSGVVIVGHTVRDAYISKICSNRLVINLWHGVIFKNIELLMKNLSSSKKQLIKQNAKIYNAITASSDMDQIKMAQAFNLNINHVHVTGLPRYEILKNSYQYEDKALEEEATFIQKIKSNKKLVLYAPTFRETTYNPLDDLNFQEIDNIANKNNFIFAIRVHPYTKVSTQLTQFKNITFINNDQCKETNILLKYTDLLIVDYSSIWIDFLLLKKPIIMYTPDLENYTSKERGFAYDFRETIDFNIHKNFDNVLKEIPNSLKQNSINYSRTHSIFHNYDLSFDYKKAFREMFNSQYKDFFNE